MCVDEADEAEEPEIMIDEKLDSDFWSAGTNSSKFDSLSRRHSRRWPFHLDLYEFYIWFPESHSPNSFAGDSSIVIAERGAAVGT